MRTTRWSRYQWSMIILISSAFMLGYVDRVNMSVVVPVWITKYHLNPAVAGVVLSIFSWAYAIATFFSGAMAERWHQRRVLPLGMAIWTVATWLTALIFSVPLFVGVRILLGLGESVVIPSSNRTFAEIFEKRDMAKVIGIFYAVSQVGLALGFPIAAFILSRLGWQAVFLITGAFSIVWLLFWLPIYRPDRGIVLQEVFTGKNLPKRASWITLLRNRQTWGIMIGQFGGLYMLYVYVTWLPSILALQLHLDILHASWFTSLIILVEIVGMIVAGWLSDLWLQRGGNLTVVRKTFCCGGMLLATICIAVAAFMHSAIVIILLLMLAIVGFSLFTPASGVLPIDLASHDTVASLSSLQGFFGSIGSALAPLVTGVLYAQTGNFQVALLVTGAITLIFGVGGFGLLLGKVEQSVSLTTMPAGENVLSVE